HPTRALAKPLQELQTSPQSRWPAEEIPVRPSNPARTSPLASSSPRQAPADEDRRWIGRTPEKGQLQGGRSKHFQIAARHCSIQVGRSFARSNVGKIWALI